MHDGMTVDVVGRLCYLQAKISLLYCQQERLGKFILLDGASCSEGGFLREAKSRSDQLRCDITFIRGYIDEIKTLMGSSHSTESESQVGK